jgi:hypothetical protein
MNPKHFPIPTSKRALCPVCKKAVYSISGIHPQCAMSQAESKKPGEPGSGIDLDPSEARTPAGSTSSRA